MTAGIDWPGLLRAGVLGLRLEPAAFWRLTPVELRLMLGTDAAIPALTRTRLAELAAAFPDRTMEGPDEIDHGTAGSGGRP